MALQSPPETPLVAELKRENARLRKVAFARTGLAELIVEQVRELYADVAAHPLPTPPPARPVSRKRQCEIAVLHVSDTQIGKATASYDVTIAHARLVELARRACECIDAHRAYASVERVHVYLGGDIVEGESIFPGQAHEIAENVGRQAIRSAPDALSDMLKILAGHVDRVHVVAVTGNHGRSAPRSMGAHPASNWDAVVYGVLRERLRAESRISWNVPDTWYAVDEVFGWRNLVTHGDLIRGGFAGFPFYGVGKKISGWADALGVPWHNLYFGHFHTMASGRQNSRAWYCNGTTESDNDYARAELAATGLPMQRLQFFNARHGMVADRPIYLTFGLDPQRWKAAPAARSPK